MKKKKILITGSNGGIGQALCKKFSENDWYVVGTDQQKNSVNKLNEYYQINLMHIEDKPSIDCMLNLSKSVFNNGLDCLINNAALQIVKPFKDLTHNDFINSLKINTIAPFILLKHFMGNIVLSKGSVINIGSIHAKLTKKNFLAYSTSKAALEGLTRSLAVEYGSLISVNGISPAAIESKMLLEGFKGNISKIDALRECHPANKIGDTATVAELSFFLANCRDRFLNGSIIDLSGGISSQLHDPE